jgi:pimeloyl-ACP methyl ester carboxylesterase
MTSFVLVHGGWHGGWCYRRVAQILIKAGHDVFTPTLTGLGERSHLLGPDITLDTHITDVLNVIKWEGLSDVVLCGHSYGGVVVTGVADAIADHLSAVVYLDALVIEDGQSAMSILTEARRSTLLHDAAMHGGGIAVPPPSPELWGVNQHDLEWVRRNLTPHPLASLQQQIRLNGDYRKPKRTYVYAKGGTSGRFYEMCLRDPTWTVLTTEGGHAQMVDDPTTVASILMRSAA